MVSFTLQIQRGRLLARGLRRCPSGTTPDSFTLEETANLFMNEVRGWTQGRQSLLARLKTLGYVLEPGIIAALRALEPEDAEDAASLAVWARAVGEAEQRWFSHGPPPPPQASEGRAEDRSRHCGALRRSPKEATRIAGAVCAVMPLASEEWSSGAESSSGSDSSARGRPAGRERHCGKGRTTNRRRPAGTTPQARSQEDEGSALIDPSGKNTPTSGAAKAAASLVQPAHLRGRAGPAHGRAAVTAGPVANASEAQALANELIMSRLAGNTRRAYDNQWGWWALFCRAKGLDPLRSVNRDNARGEEELFLEYIVHCSSSVPRAPGTVKLRLAAIRNRHVSLGLPDPLTFMPRVPLALEGYKRQFGTKERRRPVTVAMLKWIGLGLNRRRLPDHAILWAALLLGFFFLLRVSELLPPDASSLTPNRGIRGCDLEG
jgi:hypothetical protein